MKPLKILVLLIALLPLATGADELSPADDGSPTPEAMEAWQDMRFGMFIHWGPVALTGHEIGWSRGKETSIEAYDSLYKRFNPTKFNANEWAKAAKNAGMKYLVLTTKHHDGFCLWDSKFTDYDIMATPFKRDVVMELAEACRAEGISFGAYYSTCDWWHPEFPVGSPGGTTKKPDAEIDRYAAYLENQVTELVTKYGPLACLWFDVPQSYTAKHGIPMVRKLRQLQPSLVINNRAYNPDLSGSGHGVAYHNQVADYDTPEQKIGGYQDSRPWESCMTICRQWAWKPNDNMKSLDECLRTLLLCVGGNGNLLLNVGPTAEGVIETRQVERLAEMGEWLKRNGKAVYGTRGGPVKPTPNFVTTRKGNSIFLHAFSNAPVEIDLPAFDRKLLSATTMTGEQIEVSLGKDRWTVKLPKKLREQVATVIELRLNDSAMTLKAVDVPKQFGESKASGFFQKDKQYASDKAFDGDLKTRWATDEGVTSAWVEANLAKPTKIKAIVINEPAEFQRVNAFTLKIKVNGEWTSLFEGKKIAQLRKDFPPVKIEALRLEITDASDGPTISEIKIIPATN